MPRSISQNLRIVEKRRGGQDASNVCCQDAPGAGTSGNHNTVEDEGDVLPSRLRGLATPKSMDGIFTIRKNDRID
jgi:hypothetical protein